LGEGLITNRQIATLPRISGMAKMYDCICEVLKIKIKVITQKRPAGSDQRTYSTSVIMYISVDDRKPHQLLSEWPTKNDFWNGPLVGFFGLLFVPSKVHP
jgi:hypothetical protein